MKRLQWILPYINNIIDLLNSSIPRACAYFERVMYINVFVQDWDISISFVTHVDIQLWDYRDKHCKNISGMLLYCNTAVVCSPGIFLREQNWCRDTSVDKSCFLRWTFPAYFALYESIWNESPYSRTFVWTNPCILRGKNYMCILLWWIYNEEYVLYTVKYLI